MDCWTQDHPDKGLVCANVPNYAEVIAKGVGHYLLDPSKADPKRIVYE